MLNFKMSIKITGNLKINKSFFTSVFPQQSGFLQGLSLSAISNVTCCKFKYLSLFLIPAEIKKVQNPARQNSCKTFYEWAEGRH